MERMEFLGDAVLGLMIAARLYEQFPHATEGELTRMRAVLVCRNALLGIAEKWDVSSFLKLGPGERDKGGKAKSTSIAANAVEAIIGAAFLDGGWAAARSVVLSTWADLLSRADVFTRDAKTRLQEFTQAHGLGLPEYSVHDRGAGHSPRFEAECRVDGKMVAKGSGERKKAAESEAAEQTWRHLHANPDFS